MTIEIDKHQYKLVNINYEGIELLILISRSGVGELLRALKQKAKISRLYQVTL